MYKKTIRWLLRILSKHEIKERNYALGITSFIDIKKDIHCIFLDYDTKDITFVMKDVKELVSFWNLGDYEIFNTKEGFHVMFWDSFVPYSRLKMIINYSNCDPMFKYISKFHPAKTLRVSGKYKVRDIFYIGRFIGKKSATIEERELGNLKKQEYLLLKNSHMFKEEVLR